MLAAGIFAVSALLDRLVISSIQGRLRKINQETAISEKQLGWSLRNLNQKEIIAEEYQKYITHVRKNGSDEEEVARILGEIESLARNSSVYLVDMKPQMPKEIDFYRAYAVEIEAEGEMKPLINFLQQLNGSSQLLRAEKLRLKSKEKNLSIMKASMLITKVLIL